MTRLQPFQTTRLKAERLLRLLVRGAAELCAVIDRVLPDRGPRPLLDDSWRRRGTDESCERRQPNGDWRRVVIDDVVDAGRCREDVCSGDCRVLDLDPGPNAAAVTNDGDLLLARVIGVCPLRVVPSAWPVEESVPQGRRLPSPPRSTPALRALGRSARSEPHAGWR